MSAPTFLHFTSKHYWEQFKIIHDMKKIKIIVENSSDGMFWCYTEDSINNIGLNAYGKSVADAKKDLAECLNLAKEEAESRGEEFPDIEFVYKYDL